MHLRVPRINLNGKEAKALMEKEGTRHFIKDTEITGHIWIEGYNGPMALSYFEVDRDAESVWGWSRLWDEKYGTKGWVGTTARGWRTEEESFARVELVYVGEDAIKTAAEKERRKISLQTGCLHVWPWGVPRPRPRSEEDKQARFSLTVAYLETLKTPDERFRAAFNRSQSEYSYQQCDEMELWGFKAWVDNRHTTAILPKEALETVKAVMGKDGVVYDDSLTLHDLTKRQEEGYSAAYTWDKGPKIGFSCELVDTAIRAFYPRLFWKKHAPQVKVHYPNRSAPLILSTQEHDRMIVVAPCHY